MPLLQTIKQWPVVSTLHAAYRRRQQEQLYQRTQADYQQRAAATGIRVLEGADLQNALRNRLATRPHPSWPKRKGDLHIFLAYYVSNWEFVLPLALSPFGKVTPFEWTSLGFDVRQSGLESRQALNRAMLDAFHAAHRLQPVDAVIGYLSGGNTQPETLAEMARSGAAIFNFCFDDKLCFPGRKVDGQFASPAALADVVDLNLTSAPASRVKYAVHGGLSIFFPEAALPEIHKPYDLPFEFDVSFVGARYGWRGPFIDKLQRLLAPSQIKVTCFGPGWPGGQLSDEDMVKLYSRSRINLGFAGVGYSRNLMCLKGRDFEVPTSGGLYLTQDNPELSLVLEVGQEILTYKDEEDCARIIRELLADPPRAAAIRQAGRTRCLRDHTYEARWTAPLKTAGLLAD